MRLLLSGASLVKLRDYVLAGKGGGKVGEYHLAAIELYGICGVKRDPISVPCLYLQNSFRPGDLQWLRQNGQVHGTPLRPRRGGLL